MKKTSSRRGQDEPPSAPPPPSAADAGVANAPAEAEDKQAPEAGDAADTEPGDGQPETPPGAADQAAQWKDKWLRALAEAENVRKRARQDLEETRRFGASLLLQGMLPVLDNLQRALAHASADVPGDFLEGLQLIEQQWLDTLRSHGVTPVPAPRGEAPDPSLHRVLLEQESDDLPPGTIAAELVRGYLLHDRLLREAQVAVARKMAHPDADVEPSPDEQE